MPTVINKSGFRLMIYTRDHASAHVHVWHQGKEAIIEFGDELLVRDNSGFNRRELAVARLIVEQNLDFLLFEWRKIHG